MPVKVSKLWSDTKFQKLSDQAKLLYLYLSTSKEISVVGTLKPNLDVVKIELGFSIDELDRAAFGFAPQDIKKLHPNDLKIKWKSLI